MTKTDGHTGLLQLLAIRDGTAPRAPTQELLGCDLVAVTEGTATFSVSTQAVRPTTGPLLAEGSVVHRERTVATAESRLLAEDGTLHAHATSTCLIVHHCKRTRPSNAAVGSARADTSAD